MSDTQSNIESLALSMGVSVHDVRCMCQGIADGISKDKAANIFIESDSDTKDDFVGAYMQSQCKKIEEITARYFTVDGAKEALRDMVLSL